MTDRRDALAQAATDYVLEHGLIGLSLRPLAAGVGTSDRMLLYHFGDKSRLLATVLEVSNERSVAGIRELPASTGPRAAVLDLWRLLSSPPQARCQRLYVEAAALGVLGSEPFVTVVASANLVWLAALRTHFEGAGLEARDAGAAARLVGAAFMGLQLDEPIEDPDVVRSSVEDLADAVAMMWGGARPAS